MKTKTRQDIDLVELPIAQHFNVMTVSSLVRFTFQNRLIRMLHEVAIVVLQ